MSATGTTTRWALGAALATAALAWSGTAVSDDADVNAHRRFRRELRQVLGPATTPAMIDQLDAQARAAGELRVSGRRHFSGRVLASRLTVEAGSELTVDPGTVIYAADDLRIDAPL